MPPEPTVWGAAPDDASVAVLAVHGRDQSPAYMQEQSRRFDLGSLRFYAPQATGSSWYPLSFLKPIAENQPGVDDSLAVVDATLELLRRDGFDASRTVLWGFSQGACVLSQWLLTRPDGAQRALLFTGGFIGEQPPTSPAPQATTTAVRSVVLRSISQDPFVPAPRVQATAALLAEHGADVDLRIDPGSEHIITDEAFATGSRLITG